MLLRRIQFGDLWLRKTFFLVLFDDIEHSHTGFVGGGFAGLQKQWSGFVLGAEVGYLWMDQPESSASVFVSPGNGNADALNRKNPITASLQELMMLYPGSLLSTSAHGFTFEPLAQTGTVSGLSSFFDLVVRM